MAASARQPSVRSFGSSLHRVPQGGVSPGFTYRSDSRPNKRTEAQGRGGGAGYRVTDQSFSQLLSTLVKVWTATETEHWEMEACQGPSAGRLTENARRVLALSARSVGGEEEAD